MKFRQIRIRYETGRVFEIFASYNSWFQFGAIYQIHVMNPNSYHLSVLKILKVVTFPKSCPLMDNLTDSIKFRLIFED